jgi:hypothetical protein
MKIFRRLLTYRYENQQAKYVIEYEKIHLKMEPESEYENEFLKNWNWRCIKTKKNQRAYRRLGNKINYLALYDYCHTVDDLVLKMAK